jgi:SAM-dependent methyltransferase
VTHDSVDWVRLHAAHDDIAGPFHRQIADWIDPPSGARILDAGCGAGGMLAAFRDAELTGIDIDAASLSMARERVPRATLVEGDVLDPAVAPGPYDVVVARAMVHHLPDQVAGIRALADRLAPGGTFVLGEGGLAPSMLPADVGHGEPGLEARLRVAQDRWFGRMRHGIHAHVPFAGGWGLALEAAGLRVEAVRTFVDEQPPPVSALEREVARTSLGRYLDDEYDDLVDDGDRATLRWLLDPENPLGVDRRRDLHLIAAQTHWRAVRG